MPAASDWPALVNTWQPAHQAYRHAVAKLMPGTLPPPRLVPVGPQVGLSTTAAIVRLCGVPARSKPALGEKFEKSTWPLAQVWMAARALLTFTSSVESGCCRVGRIRLRRLIQLFLVCDAMANASIS